MHPPHRTGGETCTAVRAREVSFPLHHDITDGRANCESQHRKGECQEEPQARRRSPATTQADPAVSRRGSSAPALRRVDGTPVSADLVDLLDFPTIARRAITISSVLSRARSQMSAICSVIVDGMLPPRRTCAAARTESAAASCAGGQTFLAGVRDLAGIRSSS